MKRLPIFFLVLLTYLFGSYLHAAEGLYLRAAEGSYLQAAEGSHGLVYNKTLENDISMLGTWSGEQYNKFNALKQWTATRREDGGFYIHFKIYPKNSDLFFESHQSGRWWTEGDTIFYQPDQFSGIHAYRYGHISEGCVAYELLINTPNSDADVGYSFTECQTMDKPSRPQSPRDE